MATGSDRILTTHVGSLARPEDLRETLNRRHLGQPYNEAIYRQRCREAVGEIVRQQLAHGIDVVCDGEMSKISYTTYVKHRLNGISDGADATPGAKPAFAQHNFMPPDWQEHPDFREFREKMFGGPSAVKPPVFDGKVSYRDLAPLNEDIANLKAAAARTGAQNLFMNAASPGVLMVFIPTTYYTSEDEYIGDLAEAMRHEYEAIANAGIMLQIDAPDIALARWLRYTDRSDDEFVRIAERNAEAINHATRNIPPEKMRLHVCWGNYQGPHSHDFPVSRLMGALTRLRPQQILFEAANPRHDHEWEDWKAAKLPDDKILVPGLVDSCVTYVEHPRLIAQRLQRYVDIVGRDRVMAGTDCGFATWAVVGYQVMPSIVWKKFEALAEGARMVSDKAWGRASAA